MRKTPQMTTAMPERLRAQAVAIAKLEGESDYLGAGYAAVVRRETQKYVNRRMARWREQLDPELRD
jgi:hypothetical protein